MKHSALILFAFSAGAQTFTAGVKAGLPLTEFVNTGGLSSSGTGRYLVGGSAEVRFRSGLGIEADAVYRHFDYPVCYCDTGSSAGPADFTTIPPPTVPPAFAVVLLVRPVGAWEFPLLLKYRFRGRRVRPFVDAGAAWDIFSGYRSMEFVSFPQAAMPSWRGQKEVATGLVVGAGLEIRAMKHLHVLPEVRYTRWMNGHFSSPYLSTNRNQAELMVGITF